MRHHLEAGDVYKHIHTKTHIHTHTLYAYVIYIYIYALEKEGKGGGGAATGRGQFVTSTLLTCKSMSPSLILPLTMAEPPSLRE